ncbi:MAG: enoyl-CoA hydratase/isomerase family protein [Burkholderiaceae bacterium]|jgi:2-(1,2-epoxy-1,2-dihydrophenyl)acetyl-CoA isomerase|nr:enoyl-CoA hydratase/isomerase family protein [Burkholderiales bacterium]MCZ8102065.1 enoyl-CoA hydratase/isomerase family protein [Burkholderiales bacterium]MCZ8337879.1 enoyl-CoA hydratase/isomerase family protein [Burkholderiaceae bacterium]
MSVEVEEPHPGVVVVALAKPERRNALNPETRERLHATIASADARGDVAAIVITGRGGHFCAGGDAASLATLDERSVVTLLRSTHAMMRTLLGTRAMTIAAVDGWAAGGGAGLALACDHVVMAPDARIGLQFHRIGLVPDCALLYTLPRRVGPARAASIALSPRAIGAAEAVALGAADEVADGVSALPTALRRAIAATEVPTAVRERTRAILRGASHSLEAVLAAESEAQSRCVAEPAFRAGIDAFLAKSSRGGAHAGDTDAPSGDRR